MPLFKQHQLQYAFLFLLLQCLIHQATALSTTTEASQQKCADNECRQSNAQIILRKFIREQQRKKQQQLLENHETGADRQHFIHHSNKTTKTSAPIARTNYRQNLGKRNSSMNSQNSTATNSLRRTSTKLAYNTTTDTASPHNGTEPYAEQIVLYMVAQRKCNHHRRRCDVP
uniref:Uncharacterized protein n=1 Tax=Bactrocera latifrons TaxID=174628 RepID=A0A0K8U1Y5_BACLA